MLLATVTLEDHGDELTMSAEARELEGPPVGRPRGFTDHTHLLAVVRERDDVHLLGAEAFRRRAGVEADASPRRRASGDVEDDSADIAAH